MLKQLQTSGRRIMTKGHIVWHPVIQG